MRTRKRKKSVLAELRLSKGLTQTQTAFHAGISQDHYWRIENGRTPMSGTVLVALADAYGMSVDRLRRLIGWNPNIENGKRNGRKSA